MKYTDLFKLIIKTLGIILLVNALFFGSVSLLQVFALVWQGFDDVVIFLFLVAAQLIPAVMCLFATEWLVRILRLSQGFSDENIRLESITLFQLTKVTWNVMGAWFLFHGFSQMMAYSGSELTKPDSYANPEGLSVLQRVIQYAWPYNLIIGYLLFAHAERMTRLLFRKPINPDDSIDKSDDL